MITSTANQRIKNLIKCMKSAKERKKEDIFFVEGVRMFVEIPREQIIETYVTASFFEKNEAVFEGIEYEFVADHVMQALTDTKTPQGVFSVVRRKHYSLEEVCEGENSLIIALEKIQDPGNLGTILRTAEGAGVTGIIMSKDTVDVYNPKVVRSTMGSIFRVPFYYTENIVADLQKLNNDGFATYSAHLSGKSFYDYNYQKATVFCIGNEGNGLTDALAKTTNYKIKIPMQGKVESLNAATASTVLMYEAMRQRTVKNRQN